MGTEICPWYMVADLTSEFKLFPSKMCGATGATEETMAKVCPRINTDFSKCPVILVHLEQLKTQPKEKQLVASK